MVLVGKISNNRRIIPLTIELKLDRIETELYETVFNRKDNRIEKVESELMAIKSYVESAESNISSESSSNGKLHDIETTLALKKQNLFSLKERLDEYSQKLQAAKRNSHYNLSFDDFLKSVSSMKVTMKISS
jgi:hypothetical protein